MEHVTQSNHAASASSHEHYRFGEFELEPAACELRRNGRPVALTSRSLDVLVYLIRNRPRPVSRAELLRALWPNVRVASGSLSQAVWEIRKALGNSSTSPGFIKTLRGYGYRFAGPLPEQPHTDLHAKLKKQRDLAPTIGLVSSPVALNELAICDLAKTIGSVGPRPWPPELRQEIRKLTKDDLVRLLELARH